MRAGLTTRRIVFVAIAGLAVALVPATPALANPPCGAAAVANVTLTADLVCAGDAIVVGADNITIDLAGFAIIGSGTGIAIGDQLHPGLVVRNGTISGFATGIDLFGLTGATISRVTVRDGQGLHARIANDVAVSSSEFRATSMLFEANSRRAVFNQVLFRSTTLSLRESNDAKMTRGDLLDSVVDGWESDAATITDSSFVRSSLTYRTTSRNWLVQNNVFRATRVGLTVGPTSPGGRILANTFINNNLGIFLPINNLGEIDGTIISGNTFVNNGAAGVLFNSAAITGAPIVRITANQFVHNGFAPAGRLDRLGRVVLDGLHTATPAGSQIIISANVGIGNARYGIFADPGTVVDGGTNETIGDPSGCLGVVCT